MGLAEVQRSILDVLQKNTGLDSEFSDALTGTLTSAGTSISGSGTMFASEVMVGDYIGNTTSGYRIVSGIASDTELTVESAFDVEMVGSTTKITQIRKGLPKDEKITKIGKSLRLVSTATSEYDKEVPNRKVGAVYVFLLAIIFTDTDENSLEDRKAFYDKSVRNVIDMNPTFNGAVIGTTSLGQMIFTEHPLNPNINYAFAQLVVTRHETRGSR